MNRLSEKYNTATAKGKIAIIAAILLGLVLLIAVSLYTLGLSLRNIPGNDKSLSPFYFALNTKFGRPLSIAMIMAILLGFVFVLFSASKKNYVKSDDSRGVHYMEQATHGSAEWMSKERAKEICFFYFFERRRSLCRFVPLAVINK